mmetsp:Transcript_18657/g.44186  ORF Transcript_18657/g.44186 Transcript_18657/m.44186 type:complete len:300 (+) Transcript_18657:1544-2443(+)
MLVHHAAVASFFRVGLHGSAVCGKQPGHGRAQGEGHSRDHVLPGEALNDVEVEGDAVVQKALGGGHVQLHHLQHAKPKGLLQGVAPARHVLHQRRKELQWRDGFPLLVQVDEVFQLCLHEAGHAFLRYGCLGWDVGPVMVQEAPNVQTLLGVHLLALQLVHDTCGLADVPGDHAMRHLELIQVASGGDPGFLVEVHTHHGQRMVFQHLASSRVVTDVRIDAGKQVTIATASVNHKLRLLIELLVVKDQMHMAQQILEERRMLRTAADHIQGSLHMNLIFIGIQLIEAPSRIFEQQLVEA